MDEKKLYRMIDVNVNRAREGCRVVEDILRFYYNDRALSSALKSIRHALSKSFDAFLLVEHRGSGGDVGRPAGYDRKIKKTTLKGLALANLIRAQESARVLEEFAKLAGKRSSRFKEIRFKLYDLEKRILRRIK